MRNILLLSNLISSVGRMFFFLEEKLIQGQSFRNRSCNVRLFLLIKQP
jgi:hypothetical protein